MIRFRTVAATAALALLAAPAAFAQSTGAPTDPNAQASQGSMGDQNAPSAPSAASSGVNTSAIVYQSSPTPADQAYTLKAGDPTVVSNAPIPDTRANRQAFGRPLSMTGRKTAPAGN